MENFNEQTTIQVDRFLRKVTEVKVSQSCTNENGGKVIGDVALIEITDI